MQTKASHKHNDGSRNNHILRCLSQRQTMFAELPSDIQGHIRDSLNVYDRARLMVALPKSITKHLRKKDPKVERSLGILSKAIRKKRLRGLTHPIRLFLEGSVDMQDPTLSDMVVFVPEVMHVTQKKATLQDATDIDTFLHSVATTEPKDVQNVLGHRFFAENPQSVLFKCMQYNMALLEAIVPLCDATHIQYIKSRVKFMTYNMDSFRFLLRLVDLSRDELEEVYTYAVGEMCIEAAVYVDSLMN